MRQILWAALSAAVIVPIVHAQTAPPPGPVTIDPGQKHVVIDPPRIPADPCLFLQVGLSSPCKSPPPAQSCLASQRCADLTKQSAHAVPL